MATEIWANYPSQQLIPLWHQDSYPKLLEGEGKSINAYIALTEVNEFNGFKYIPSKYQKDDNLILVYINKKLAIMSYSKLCILDITKEIR